MLHILKVKKMEPVSYNVYKLHDVRFPLVCGSLNNPRTMETLKMKNVREVYVHTDHIPAAMSYENGKMVMISHLDISVPRYRPIPYTNAGDIQGQIARDIQRGLTDELVKASKCWAVAESFEERHLKSVRRK